MPMVQSPRREIPTKCGRSYRSHGMLHSSLLFSEILWRILKHNFQGSKISYTIVNILMASTDNLIRYIQNYSEFEQSTNYKVLVADMHVLSKFNGENWIHNRR